MLEQFEDIEDLKMLKIFSVQKPFNESFEGQNSPFSFLTFRLTWLLYPSCSHKIAPTKFVIVPLRSCYPRKHLAFMTAKLPPAVYVLKACRNLETDLRLGFTTVRDAAELDPGFRDAIT